MHCQVKWMDEDGRTRYGIYREEKRGVAVVDDAVMPWAYRVPAAKLVDIPLKPPVYSLGKTTGGDELHKYVDKHYRVAQRVSSALGDKLCPGKLFSTSVGDGRAWYVVTAVGKKTVDIEWRGYCPDRYSDQVLGWGGRFPRSAVAPLVQRQAALAKIFGS